MTTAGYRGSASSVDCMPLYSSYVLKSYNTNPLAFTMAMSNDPAQGQQGGDNFNTKSVSTFHTPSFGDEDFDLPVLPLASDQDSGNAGNTSQAPFSHQMLSNLDLGLNPALTVAPTMQTADCAPLTSMRGPHPIAPKFPPQNFDVPDINVTNSVMASATNADNIFASIAASTGTLFHDVIPDRSPISSHQSLSTISQTQMATHLGFQTAVQGASPPGSNSTSSPSRESSEDSDDSLPLAQLMSLKRSGATTAPSAPSIITVTTAQAPVQSTITTTTTTTASAPTTAKKQKTPKKKKKKDPNEPQKPVSAYALFFRDTQAAIKGQSPNKSFGDVSKIVASMWDGLEPDNKNVYKKKTEVAKKEYLKQLAAYRASQVSQAAADEASSMSENSPSPPNISQMSMSGAGNSMGMMSQMTHVNMPSPPQQQQMMTSSYNSPPHQPPYPIQNMAPQQQNNGMTYQQSDYCQNMNQMDTRAQSNGLCVRNGCINQAIDNPGWDSEYCSNECVVSHCRDIFTAWVASKQGGSTFQVK
ncbi:TOX high mobility group box family member 3-like isoform X1 [Haliotis rubra]|uniref:TOX high mobility group box family member 3-like isoform X1 n=2 Tax=Haliotis rubra TaxID=36100 RepID=UPI001EE5FF7E|nr:TOX high mobility group box family member 3-like isoform X1 [Haliotis rubra]